MGVCCCCWGSLFELLGVRRVMFDVCCRKLCLILASVGCRFVAGFRVFRLRYCGVGLGCVALEAGTLFEKLK